MAKDFRASQVETSRLIASGAIAGSTVGIVVYSGSIATDREGTTANPTVSKMLEDVGSDVFLFVSGTINTDNIGTSGTKTDVTLFGGDVVVSGTLYAERQVVEVDSTVPGNFYVTGNMYVEPDSDSTTSVAFSNAAGTVIFNVDATNKRVGIGDETPDALLDIQGEAASGVPSLIIDHDDTNEVAISVVAANIDADVLDITADAVTTANVIDVSADSLTTGTALKIDDNSANTGNRDTVSIIQNNAAAIGAVALSVTSDGGKEGVFVDKNYSDTAAATIRGVLIDVDKTASTTSDNTIVGVDLAVNNETATNGTNNMSGIKINTTLTHAANAGTTEVKAIEATATGGTNGASEALGATITATGADVNTGIKVVVPAATNDSHVKLISSADSEDLFKISVGTAGATTITTIDSDEDAANLNFVIDGAVDIQSHGAITIDSSNSTIGVGTDAINQTINIGTGGNRSINIGKSGGTSTVSIYSKGGTLELDATGQEVNIDSAAFDVNASGAITIDGVGTSNITAHGALTISGSDGLNLKADTGTLDIETRQGNIDIDSGGAVTIDTTGGAISIGGTATNGNISIGGSGNRSVGIGSALVNTTISLVSRGGTLLLDGTGQTVDLNSAAFDIDATGAVTIDSTSTFSVDGQGTSNVSTHGKLILSGSDNLDLHAREGEIDITNEQGAIDVNAGTTIDIDADGALTIDSGTSIAIGANADKPIDIDASTLDIVTSDNITLTAGGSGKTIDIDASGALTIDSATSISIGVNADKPVTIDSTTLDINSSGPITIDGTSTFSVDAVGTSNLTTHGALTISGSDGLNLKADSGTIDIEARGGAIDLDAAGVISIDTTNTATGVTIGTGTSAVPVSIGHTTSETTVNDNLNVTGELLIAEFIKHTGDTDTFIEFEDNAIKLKAADKNFLQFVDTDGMVVINNDSRNDIMFVAKSDNRNALVVDAESDRVLIHSGGAAGSYNEADGADVGFYVSGSVGHRGLGSKSIALFGGDTHMSGAIGFSELAVSPSVNVNEAVLYAKDQSGITKLFMKQSDGQEIGPLGSGGSLDDAYDTPPGGGAKSAGSGAIITADNQPVQIKVSGGSSTALAVTGSVIFGSGSTGLGSSGLPELPGTDTHFFVSGSIGRQGTFGTSVFGGDLVVSGALNVDTSVPFSIDGSGTSNITTNGGLTLSGSTGLNLKSDSGNIDIETRTGAIDIDAAGLISIDSSGGRIDIGVANVNQNINIGTDGTRGITVGEAAGGGGGGNTTVTINSQGGTLLLDGTGQIVDLNSAAFDIDATGAVTIDGSSTLSIDASGDTNVTTSGGVLTLESGKTGAAALLLSASHVAGGIKIQAGTGDILIESDDDVDVVAKGDIVLDSDAGNIILKDDGTTFLGFQNASNDAVIYNSNASKDIIFKGNNGAVIEILRIDVSAKDILMAAGNNVSFGAATRYIGDGTDFAGGTPNDVVIQSSNGIITAPGAGSRTTIGLGPGTGGAVEFSENNTGNNILMLTESNGSAILSSSVHNRDIMIHGNSGNEILKINSFDNALEILEPVPAGNDVNFNVSGSIGKRGLAGRHTTVFGGDMVVSGGIHMDLVPGTDSTTKLSIGNSDTTFIKSPGSNVLDVIGDTVRIGTLDLSSDGYNPGDTNFFVSGTIGTRGTAEKGTSVFSGDVVVSGSLLSSKLIDVKTFCPNLNNGTLVMFLANPNRTAGTTNNINDHTNMIMPFSGSLVKISMDVQSSCKLGISLHKSQDETALAHFTASFRTDERKEFNIKNGYTGSYTHSGQLSNTWGSFSGSYDFNPGDQLAVGIHKKVGSTPGTSNINLIFEYDVVSKTLTD